MPFFPKQNHQRMKTRHPHVNLIYCLYFPIHFFQFSMVSRNYEAGKGLLFVQLVLTSKPTAPLLFAPLPCEYRIGSLANIPLLCYLVFLCLFQDQRNVPAPYVRKPKIFFSMLIPLLTCFTLFNGHTTICHPTSDFKLVF